MAIRVGNKRLEILVYADDVIMMSKNGDDLQVMLNAVAEYGQDLCVKFSNEKSKAIVVSGTDEDTKSACQLGDTNVKRTKKYIYLGVSPSEKRTERVIQEKVTKANKWYGRLTSVARYRANKYEELREL